MNSLEWAIGELGGSNLGDLRRSDRMVKIA